MTDGRKEFGDAITELLSAVGLNANSVTKSLQAGAPSRSTLYDWIQGNHLPESEQALLDVVEHCRQVSAARSGNAARPPIRRDDEWLRILENARRARDESAIQSSGDKPSRTTPPRRTIAQWDPVDLGVHRGIDGLTAAYITRAHDGWLRAALDPKVRTGRIVVLRGDSSTGKTRAAYAAVADRLKNWAVDYPATPQLLAARLDRGIAPRTVLWLNELRHYADAPDGPGVLARLADGLAALDRVIVITGVWEDNWRRYVEESSRGGEFAFLKALTEIRGLPLADPTRGGVIDVAEHFDSAELGEALRTEDPALTKAVEAAERAGTPGQITQYLAGVPALLERYEGPGADPYAHALITAAMDAVRLGHSGPLTADLLISAAPAYLANRDRARVHDPEAQWAAALAHASEQLHGAVHALEPMAPEAGTGIAGYRLADFLDQHGRRERRRTLVPASLWEAVLEHTTDPGDLAAVGASAEKRADSR